MTPESTPLVSVVTPVYNGERYLRECIESVLAQTYANWHYVIVDNCRTELLGGPHVFGTPTTLLYRSTLTTSRDSFYNESNIHADTEACVEFLEHWDFGFVHQILTFNRKEEGSLTSFSDRTYTYLPA